MTYKNYFKSNGSELLVGDVPVTEIIKEFGTPIFIYDQEILSSKLDLLRKTFTNKFQIYYSIKANPNPEIIKFFVSRDCGLEIASSGELALALKSGCSSENILFAGPGKTFNELESAIDQNIGEIHVESFQELDRIAQIAKSRKVEVQVTLRINPKEEAQGGAMRMGGKPAPFGFDEELLDEVIGKIKVEKQLEFTGIHLFTGTQILDHEILIQQYRKGFEIARRASTLSGNPVRTIDFGGGLGIPYFSHESELNCEMLSKGLKTLIDEAENDSQLSKSRFIVEPGRFLVGESGVYVTSVNTVKDSRGKKYIIVDGGMNHHLAASGNLGQVIKRNFPLAILNKMNQDPVEAVDVVGPLCTPLDTLGRDLILPAVEVGDLVGIFQSGAYARTSSPLNFLSHPAPPEVLVDQSNFRLIHPREEIKS